MKVLLLSLAAAATLLSGAALADPAADRAAAHVVKLYGSDPTKTSEPHYQTTPSFQDRAMQVCGKHGKTCHIEPGVGVVMETPK